ncbi:hypothetical protein EVAR_57281_1 [Eumeta japonica]|uniref:Uncharacterized protein n=1 Tax=Eumeta variegata TaxID=151549 RepID=A0A4C1ZVM2_EUMVA|nr:hypothetical protein EVAR_57281_1 [Eumeta japonica]
MDSMSYKMIKQTCAFANFAKCGNPTPPGSKLGVTWLQYDPRNRNYLDIGETLTPGRDLGEKMYQFWQSVYDEKVYKENAETNYELPMKWRSKEISKERPTSNNAIDVKSLDVAVTEPRTYWLRDRDDARRNLAPSRKISANVNGRAQCDFRRVIWEMYKDSYPIPRTGDLIMWLSKAKYFARLDLLSEYWQMVVNEKYKPNTAWLTPSSVSEVTVENLEDDEKIIVTHFKLRSDY